MLAIVADTANVVYPHRPAAAQATDSAARANVSTGDDAPTPVYATLLVRGAVQNSRTEASAASVGSAICSVVRGSFAPFGAGIPERQWAGLRERAVACKQHLSIVVNGITSVAAAARKGGRA